MSKRLAFFVLAVVAVASARAAIPSRPQIDVTAYVIHAELDPATGKLSASAVVTFTALEDLNLAVFGLNNGLQLTSVSDGTSSGSSLVYERNVTDSTVRVTPSAILSKGSNATWTFTYAGRRTGYRPHQLPALPRPLVSHCHARPLYRPLYRADRGHRA